MTFRQHAVISMGLSTVLYMALKSWGLSLACLISGIFIDLDYIIDYLHQYGLPFRMKEFLKSYNEDRIVKVRIFHGWEWLVLWGTAAWLTEWNMIIIGVFIGYGQHLLLDKINFGESFLSYSFLWRWKKGFKSELIFRKSLEAKRLRSKHLE